MTSKETRKSSTLKQTSCYARCWTPWAMKKGFGHSTEFIDFMPEGQ